MSAIFKKPSNMRWVDLAIWIDENFYKEDCDHNVAYEYMYLLASMLASKHKYFDNKKDYDEFAAMLAYDTYKRMANVKKGKIKSVLNYMKSIISFRKIGYNFSKRQKIIDPIYDKDWDPISYVENCKDSYESTFKDKLFEGVSDVLHYVPSYIKEAIPKVYKVDKLLYNNIYISSMLSLLYKITLPNNRSIRFDKKLQSPTFDEVKYYSKYLNDENIVLWHLPDEMTNLVAVVINKVNNKIINEINELSNDLKVSNDEFSNIMSSGFNNSGGNRDEANY